MRRELSRQSRAQISTRQSFAVDGEEVSGEHHREVEVVILARIEEEARARKRQVIEADDEAVLIIGDREARRLLRRQHAARGLQARDAERVRFEDLGKGVFRVFIHCGFMEKPDVPKLLADAKLPVDLADATYFLGRETFLGGKGGKMGVFSESLFAFLSRNARSATSWFGIPPDQVVELGMQIDL